MRTLQATFILCLFALAPAAFSQVFIDLQNGVPVQGTADVDTFPDVLTGTLHSTQYRITIPPGATGLFVSLDFTETGDHDLDLFLNLGSQVSPGVEPYASSTFVGVDESITLTPGTMPPLIAGVYYIGIANFYPVQEPFTLTATYTGGTGQPDLVARQISWGGTSVTEGAAYFVAPIVSNEGTVAAGASHVRLFLSIDNDTNYSDDYEVLPEKAVPALAVAATNQPRWDFNFPNLADEATYPVWVIALVDSQNEVPNEINEGNTWKTTNPITVTNAAAQSPTPTFTRTHTPTFTPTPTTPGPSRQVVLESVTGPAGGTAAMNVSLSDLSDVAGLYLDVGFNGGQLSVQSVETAAITAGFRMRHNAESGRLRLAMANPSGLGPGANAAARITFAIAPGASPGAIIPVTVSETRLYSPSGGLNVAGSNGQVSVVAGGTTPTPTRTFTPTPTTPGGTTLTPTPTGVLVNARSDINQDGVVDELDLFILIQDWQKTTQ